MGGCVLNYHNVWALGFVLCGAGVMYVVYMHIVGGGLLQIADAFHTADFVLTQDLVVCVYHPLLILLSVLKCRSLGFLD
jgi:hypothetical protein